MAKKKQSSKASPAATVQQQQRKHEDDLKNLAVQAKAQTMQGKVVDQVGRFVKAGALVVLIAIYANISLLAMSPVYGQIPATIWHHHAVVWPALFIGWAGNLALSRALPVKTTLLLPLVAAYIPVAQFYLFRLSGNFLEKPEYGAALTEALTLGPLLILSSACTADILDGADFSYLPKMIVDSAPGIGSYALFRYVEMDSMKQLMPQIGQSLAQTRMGFELIFAVTYAIMGRSKLLILTVPAVLHAVFLNTHIMSPMHTSALNETLHSQEWSIVDRWESVTGYVSVLDNHKDGYRAMRCDHSLLGGEWTRYGKIIVGEPIYSVFTQLEAVRLIDVPDKVADADAKALNIGLGIGTTPSALIAHGMDTTIVEIDPIVYEFAKKYFDLPPNHTAVIDDVFHWLATQGPELEEAYDYIIHDVFTGGAEPIDLFTEEFLQALNHMLKPNGVIAINFAGDFALPPLSIVTHTIKSVFPTCRIFRESPAPQTPEEGEKEERDFDNVIIFCTKITGPEAAINFRRPVEADFLKSHARARYLLPEHEVPESAFLFREGVKTLRANETGELAEWHDHGALGHWKVMRKVLPDMIWENW